MSELKYQSKRVLSTYQDFNFATTWTLSAQQLGFEPTEVRLLQFGILNDTATATGGLIVCQQLKDFQLAIAATQTSGQTYNSTLVCPSAGPISTLDFKFCVTGSDAAQATRDTQFWMVLEFLKR